MKTKIRQCLRITGERAVGVLAKAPGLAGLKITPGNAGFFGEVFCVLNGLRLAEQHGLVAEIAWGQQSPYFEKNHVQNDDAWSSFFAQSCFDFRTPPSPRAPILFPRFKPGAHDFVPYKGQSIRRSVGKALHDWCQPKPNIADEADAAWNRIAKGREMLGVHIRLTDAAAGLEKRKAVALEHFFDATDNWLANHPNAGIFLATDEIKIIEAFVVRYGERVSFQDCLRSEDGTSIHGHYDSGVKGNAYTKGCEVFIDALLLARCDHLIRTHSRVTAFSLCWNTDLTYHDLERDLLGVDRTPWLHA